MLDTLKSNIASFNLVKNQIEDLYNYIEIGLQFNLPINEAKELRDIKEKEKDTLKEYFKTFLSQVPVTIDLETVSVVVSPREHNETTFWLFCDLGTSVINKRKDVSLRFDKGVLTSVDDEGWIGFGTYYPNLLSYVK